MMEIKLTRSREDKKRYDLEGVGSLRFGGMLSRDTEARTVDGRTWTFHEGGVFGGRKEALGSGDTPIGTFDNTKIMRHGGVLTWEGVEYQVRSSSTWKSRFAMAQGELELVTVEDKGWGKSPVTVRLEDQDIDRGVLLYFIWLVHKWTEDDSAAAGAAASV